LIDYYVLYRLVVVDVARFRLVGRERRSTSVNGQTSSHVTRGSRLQGFSVTDTNENNICRDQDQLFCQALRKAKSVRSNRRGMLFYLYKLAKK